MSDTAGINNSAVSTPLENVVLELDPHLDRVELARQFARVGRIHIPRVLTDSSARRIHWALERETPWGLVLNEGKKALELQSVSREDREKLAADAWSRAHSGFQYFYHYYPLLQNGRIYPDSDHYLSKLVAFLTGPDFLSLVRDVTGLASINRVTSTATLYKPLDFLTIHNDGTDSGKLVAYVLNLTPEWRPDWGGALLFFDRDDHIEEGYLPTFNALNLFRIPKRHSVSQVAAFGGSRYSVSGWLGTDRAI
jgi:SM-20-related protein